MKWHEEFVAWDTETTGLGSTARIIEIAAVVFENGKPTREWSTLLCPTGVDWGDPKVQEALAVNHIAPHELTGKPTFEEALPDILLEFEHDTWVAHNASFDLRMLSQEMARINRPFTPPKLSVCTKNMSSYLNTGLPGNKLAQVAPHYNIVPENAHRAVVDARTCGQVLCAMLQQAPFPDTIEEMQDMLKRADKSWTTRSRR